MQANNEKRPLVLAPGEWIPMADLRLAEVLGAGGFGAVHRGIRGGTACLLLLV